MSEPLRIAVVIPAFNEQESIASVVALVNAVQSDLVALTPVVVNDCSRDKTKDILATLNCVALNLPINLGIGGAVQTGIKYAFDNGFDYAIQIVIIDSLSEIITQSRAQHRLYRFDKLSTKIACSFMSGIYVRREV